MSFNKKPSRRYRPSRRYLTVRNRVIMVAASVLALAVLAGGAFVLSKQLQKGSEVQDNGGDHTTEPSTPSNTTPAGPQKAALTQNTSFDEWNSTTDWKLIVVNASNAVPDQYEIDADSATYKNITVDKRILDNLKAMIAAAKKEGISLWISSAYRSKSRQAQLLENEINSHIQDGLTSSEAAVQAVRLVMPAGYSEHQTGLAIDLNGVQYDFHQTDAYRWLDKHAAEYGFIERYPEDKIELTGIDYEPWHYRYVGQEAARKITAQGLCLEEYVHSLIQEE